MNQKLRNNTLFDRIIREEYMKKKVEVLTAVLTEGLRQKPLLEAGISTYSKIDPEYAKNPQYNWTGKAAWAQKILKSLGAQSYRLGINDDGMELVIYNDKNQAEDRLNFYSDGGVTSEDNGSENLGWIVKGNTVYLTEKPGSKDIVGSIVNRRGKAVYIQDPKKKAAIEKDKAEKKDAAEYTTGEKILDTIETILDWTGFVPVIGDFGDVINAVIKFSRGKWFDGLLSMIAIMPIIGTAVSLGVKTSIKALKLSKAGGKLTKMLSKFSKETLTNPKTSKELWAEFLNNKILKKDELAKLGKTFNGAAETLKAGAGWITSNVPGLTKEAKRNLLNSADQWSTFCRGAGDNLIHASDEAFDASRTGKKLSSMTANTDKYSELIGILSDKPQKITDLIATTGKYVDEFGDSVGNITRMSPIGGGVLTKIAKAPTSVSSKLLNVTAKIVDKLGYGPRKLKAIADLMAKKFIKQWSDPDRLSALLHYAPNQAALKDAIGRNPVFKHVAEQFAEGKIGKLKLTGNAVKDYDKVFRYMAKNPKYAETYQQIQAHILEAATSKETMNPLYAMYKSSQANQLKAVFSKEAINWSNTMANLGSKAKKADILFGELEDGLEAFGVIDNDERNGFIVDWLIKSVVDLVPNGLKDSFVAARKVINSTGIGKVVEPLKGAVGYDDTVGYDPSKGSSGRYTK